MRRLSWDEVRALRLRRHGLTADHRYGTPAWPDDVVRGMHGAHAQVMSAAEISIGLRLPGSTRADVRDALWRDGTLTKTYGPRGTVHLVPSADLATWTGALAAVPSPRSPFAPDVRLSTDQRTAVVAAIRGAVLAGPLTLDELDDEVVARAGAWAGDLVMPAFQVLWPRWRQALGDAAAAGALVFGPPRGRKLTYLSPTHHVPGFVPLPAEAALPEFLLGYLRAFGPATPAHLARWLTAPVDWAEELFERTRAALQPVDVEGTPSWVVADEDLGTGPPAGVWLLPYFDAFAVGFQPREALFPGRAADRALNRGQAGNYPVVLVDGVVAGVWHQRRSGRRVVVTVELLDGLPRARRPELDAAAMRIGEVLEAGSTELVLGPVEVGPHA
jgi:hypothetical protein